MLKPTLRRQWRSQTVFPVRFHDIGGVYVNSLDSYGDGVAYFDDFDDDFDH